MMRAQRRRNGMAAWLAMLLAAGGSAPAAAMTFMEVDYVCPVGGERFRAQTMGSGTVFRHFLDGQAEGAIMSPWPLVRCPGNGFVMYRDDFSAAEIATLTPFVEGEEYQRLRRVEGLLLDLRTAAEHAHVVHHTGRTLYLCVNALQFFGQVIDLRVAIAQALEHVDHGHAHHVQRLVDFVRQPRSHFTQGGHFRAVGQLLLGAAHFGVVAAHGLYFHQCAVLIKYPAVRPHPPGMFTPG